MSDSITYKETSVDFCVVGGGLSGLCAALAAARHGASVALMQDRPVLGGNASSEVRMWICGASGNNDNGKYKKETGIIEELELENFYRNYPPSFPVWDGVLYGKAVSEPNIKLLLNCSCMEAEVRDGKIISVTGWQTTTQTMQKVRAKYFSDCSGDSILAPLTGAKFRVGREAADEYGEDIEPLVADKKTMGMSCLMQLRETDKPQPFIPPEWAYKFTQRNKYDFHQKSNDNFWWIELGGENDSIADTETISAELIKIAYGVWDNIKNYGENDSTNWVLDWIGSLPGKRESRRYVGDYVLTQNDVRAEGRFDDIVAYGGWPMDDHDPVGFYGEKGKCETVMHPTPATYGIPYRCLYSANIDNLFFAGRNISVTHAAMSSTRVMGTCAVIGQAVGTAAAIAVKEGLSPRDVYNEKIHELKNKLMDDDCYIPFNKREIPEITLDAEIRAACENAENLRNGVDRPIEDEDNGCCIELSEPFSYCFKESQNISEIRLAFDSDLNRDTKNMPVRYYIGDDKCKLPQTLVKAFKVTGKTESGEEKILFETDNNRQRLVRIPVRAIVTEVSLIPIETYGAPSAHIFAFDVR